MQNTIHLRVDKVTAALYQKSKSFDFESECKDLPGLIVIIHIFNAFGFRHKITENFQNGNKSTIIPVVSSSMTCGISAI